MKIIKSSRRRTYEVEVDVARPEQPRWFQPVPVTIHARSGGTVSRLSGPVDEKVDDESKVCRSTRFSGLGFGWIAEVGQSVRTGFKRLDGARSDKDGEDRDHRTDRGRILYSQPRAGAGECADKSC